MGMTDRRNVVQFLALVKARPRHIAELARLSGLSRVTVRKWLLELEAEGMVRRVQVEPRPGARLQQGWAWV